MAAIRGVPSSLWQGDGSSLRGSALNRQVLCWRGDGLRSLGFARVKGRRKVCCVPRVELQEGRTCSGKGRQETSSLWRAGTTWDLTGEMCFLP